MIIITGGAGFIGSNLIKKLNQKRHENIIIIDDIKQGQYKNLRGLKYKKLIPINDFVKLIMNNSKEFRGTTTMIHLGAITDTMSEDIETLYKYNYFYSVKYEEWARSNGIPFIYASSASVYGNDAPYNYPLNIYAESKDLFDQYIINNKLEKKVLGLRLFNVFGPNEAHKGNMASYVYKLYQQKRNNQIPEIFDVQVKRDFIYVLDVVNIIYNYMIENKKGILDIGTGEQHTFREILNIVLNITDNTLVYDYKYSQQYHDKEYLQRYYSKEKYTYIHTIDFPEALNGKYQFSTKSKIKHDTLFSFKDSVKDYITTYLEQGLE